MKDAKIVITDCDHKDIDAETQIFNEAEMPFELKQCKTESELIEQCAGYDVFLNQYAPMTELVIAKLAPKLRLIVRYGVGVDNIDVRAATGYGVQVCNVPDYGINEVADHALTLMLALERKIVLMDHSTKQKNWDYTRAIPIFRHNTLTVGILGLGRIGRAFAKRVRVLGCRVIGYDPVYKVNVADDSDYIEQVSFETLMKDADVISIHCPAESSKNMIDGYALSLMKRTAYLVNTSRGGIIDEKALDEALSNGMLAGAALDVFAKEPVSPGYPLFRHENLICTPHMAWYSEQSAQDLKRKAAEEAVRFLKGEKCCYPINNVT